MMPRIYRLFMGVYRSPTTSWIGYSRTPEAINFRGESTGKQLLDDILVIQEVQSYKTLWHDWILLRHVLLKQLLLKALRLPWTRHQRTPTPPFYLRLLLQGRMSHPMLLV